MLVKLPNNENKGKILKQQKEKIGYCILPCNLSVTPLIPVVAGLFGSMCALIDLTSTAPCVLLRYTSALSALVLL